MTNEELADLIKAGADELIPALWEQVDKFFYLMARKWFNYSPEACTRAGVELQDLEQEAYFAFLDAMEAWKPDSGYNFLAYANFPIRNRFNAMIGRRTVAQKNNILNSCKSLHQPVGEEDIEIMDLIEDESAEQEFLSLEARLDHERLHNVLEKCLDTIKPIEADAVRMRFYEGLTLDETGKRLGVSRNMARAREFDGLRSLRRGESRRLLNPWREDIISRHAYHSGFSLWRNTGTSSTEYTAMKLLGEV